MLTGISNISHLSVIRRKTVMGLYTYESDEKTLKLF